MDQIGERFQFLGFSRIVSAIRSKAQRLAREANALDGLAALVGWFIPAEIFDPEGGQRRRIYPPGVTFVAVLGQVLGRGRACREAVRCVQALVTAIRRPIPDDSSSVYCQA